MARVASVEDFCLGGNLTVKSVHIDFSFSVHAFANTSNNPVEQKGAVFPSGFTSEKFSLSPNIVFPTKSRLIKTNYTDKIPKMLPSGFEPESSAREAEMIGRTTLREPASLNQ